MEKDEQIELVQALKLLHKVHSDRGDPCTRFHNNTGQCDVYVVTVHRDPELYRRFQELFGSSMETEPVKTERISAGPDPS